MWPTYHRPRRTACGAVFRLGVTTPNASNRADAYPAYASVNITGTCPGRRRRLASLTKACVVADMLLQLQETEGVMTVAALEQHHSLTTGRTAVARRRLESVPDLLNELGEFQRRTIFQVRADRLQAQGQPRLIQSTRKRG